MDLKKCARCKKNLPSINFSKNKRAKDGLHSWCQQCKRVMQRKYSKKHNITPARKRYIRDYHLRERYDISLEDFNELFVKQNGCCAICNIHQAQTSRRFHLDHNHKTKQIRGLLCESCNHLIGQANENPTTLVNAAIYLEKY